MAELGIASVREAERAGVPKTTAGYVLPRRLRSQAASAGQVQGRSRYVAGRCRAISSPDRGSHHTAHRPSRRRADKRIIGGLGRVNATASLI